MLAGPALSHTRPVPEAASTCPCKVTTAYRNKYRVALVTARYVSKELCSRPESRRQDAHFCRCGNQTSGKGHPLRAGISSEFRADRSRHCSSINVTHSSLRGGIRRYSKYVSFLMFLVSPSRAGFLNLNTIGIWDQRILCGGELCWAL